MTLRAPTEVRGPGPPLSEYIELRYYSGVGKRMALIKCVDCGRQVSDQAAVCVECGGPISPSYRAPERSRLSPVVVSSGRRLTKRERRIAAGAILGATLGAFVQWGWPMVKIPTSETVCERLIRDELADPTLSDVKRFKLRQRQDACSRNFKPLESAPGWPRMAQCVVSAETARELQACDRELGLDVPASYLASLVPVEGQDNRSVDEKPLPKPASTAAAGVLGLSSSAISSAELHKFSETTLGEGAAAVEKAELETEHAERFARAAELSDDAGIDTDDPLLRAQAEAWARFETEAVVQDPDGYTNIRQGPGVESPIVGRADSGETIFVNQKRGVRWWEVRREDGTTGYMHVSRIKPVGLRH